MKSIFNYILWAVLVLKVQLVWTQAVEPDSIILLKEVKVEAFRFTHHQTGLQTTTFDSIQKQNYLHRNVAEILADESPIFIKSYGLGSLASPDSIKASPLKEMLRSDVLLIIVKIYFWKSAKKNGVHQFNFLMPQPKIIFHSPIYTAPLKLKKDKPMPILATGPSLTKING